VESEWKPIKLFLEKDSFSSEMNTARNPKSLQPKTLVVNRTSSSVTSRNPGLEQALVPLVINDGENGDK
jgi:hypothetical protein